MEKPNRLILEGVMLIWKGRGEGKQYRYGLREGALDVVSSPSNTTPAERDLLVQLKRQISSGEIDVLP